MTKNSTNQEVPRYDSDIHVNKQRPKEETEDVVQSISLK